MKMSSQCPMCGSTTWQCVNVYRTGFSFGRSFLAALFLGGKNRVMVWSSWKAKEGICLSALPLYYGV